MKIVRGILAVVVGFVIATALMMAAEMLNHRIYNIPETSPGDRAAIQKLVATLPPGAFVLVLIGWFVGTLVGSFLAAKIGRSRIPVYVLSVLLLCGGIVNALMIPQPGWFTIASIAIFSFVPFAGIAMAKPPQPATA